MSLNFRTVIDFSLSITFLPTQMTRSIFRQILHKISPASFTLRQPASIIQVPQRRRLASSTMAKEFPPQKVRDVVAEVAKLLKEKKETVSVAETVSHESLENIQSESRKDL